MPVKVTFTGDTKDLKKAGADGEKTLDDFDKKSKGLGGTIKGLGGTLGGLGKAFSGVATVAGGFLLGSAILKGPAILGGLKNSFAALELQTKKATTVFAEQLPVVEAWAKGAAGAMGLTTREAVNLAAGLADLLIPMGFSREAAAKMSSETLNLAGALAEWSNGEKTATEVSEILTSAFLGETDGLKALGISISAADVEARLALKGQKDLTGAAKDQAQALAIQELVMEKSTDAQKAFAEGAGSAARKTAEMTAKQKEAKEALVTALGPAITQVMGLMATGTTFLAAAFTNEVIPRLQQFGGWFQAEAMPRIQAFLGWVRPKLVELGAWFMTEVLPRIQQFLAWLQPKLVEFGKWVQAEFAKFQVYYETDIKPALENIRIAIEETVEFIKEHWEQIGPIVEGVAKLIILYIDQIKLVLGILIDLIGGDFSGAWEKLKDLIANIWEQITTLITLAIGVIKLLAPLMLEAGKALGGALFDGVKELLSKLPGLALQVGEDVWQAIRGFINKIIRSWNDLGFDIPAVDTHIPGVGKIGGFTLSTPDIPEMARGGIVSRPTLALIGEAGPEAVVPLSRGRGGGFGDIYLSVNVGGGGDERAWARKMAPLLLDEIDRARARRWSPV